MSIQDAPEESVAVAEATYEHDFYTGKPAISSRTVGKGKAIYFGAAGCEELIGAYLDKTLAECGIPVIRLPEKVFVTERKSKDYSYTFIINMGYKEQELKYTIEGTDVISGNTVKGITTILPLQIIIVETKI